MSHKGWRTARLRAAADLQPELASESFYPQRVAVEDERQGVDLYELGAGAYPEFLTHTEEFTQR